MEVKNNRMLAQMALLSLLCAMPSIAFADNHAKLVQVVNKAATAVQIATSTSPVSAGQTIEISAAVSPRVPSVPTGTIRFVADGISTGAQLTSGPIPVASSGPTVWNATFATVDQYVVAGTYSGDNNYSSSTSPQVTQLVTHSPDFSVTWPSNLTVASGQAVSAPLTVTAEYGFSGTVTFSCGNLPPGSVCSFANQSVSVPTGAPGNDTPATVVTNMTISTNGVAAVTAGAFLLLLGIAGKKRKRSTQIGFAVCGFLLTGVLYGCGSNQYIRDPDTEPGTYSVTLTATSGSIVHSHVVSLQVSPRH